MKNEKKTLLLKIDVEVFKKFKVMSAQSEIPMTYIINDLIAESIKNDTYTLKNVIKK